ncbi:MAG: WbqC family protein [Bacteroidota bacterium]
MRLAIMQPYFFPYIGYFQLISAVNKFVFYDDVNFIKNGWINRNRIVINGSPNYFTVNLNDASPNKLIKDIEFSFNKSKLIKKIETTYKKAPFYQNIEPLILDVLSLETQSISDLAIYSVRKVCTYLQISISFEISSINYSQTKGLTRTERLKKICTLNDANEYINPYGGRVLYKKKEFLEKNINLLFLKSNLREYKQFAKEFIPGMSIIDIMMFNSPERINEMLNDYELK